MDSEQKKTALHIFIESFKTLPPEEKKVWYDCSGKEAFWNRSLPSGLLAAVSTFYLMKSSKFSAYTRTATFVFGTIGYFMGKFSYAPVCVERILNLPTLRMKLEELKLREHSELAYANTEGDLPEKEYKQQSTLDINTYQSMNLNDLDSGFASINGYSDTYHGEENLSEPINLQRSVSYDELRQKNRNEYYEKEKRKLMRQPPSVAKPSTPTEEAYKREEIWG